MTAHWCLLIGKLALTLAGIEDMPDPVGNINFGKNGGGKGP